ncbi:ligand-binding sensor domain-containing diguanylate cyclase [Lysobacter humi (ex Lee et al. 2017)]
MRAIATSAAERGRRLRLRACAALLLVLGLGPVVARAALTDDFLETWTTRDGLPHSTVNVVEQTRDGYLWLATWEGLVRYNGRDFRLFRRSEIPGLRDDSIRALHVGPHGDLWVGSGRGGLVRGRDGHWTALAPVEGLVTGLLEEPDGRLWVGTTRHGVVRIEPDGRRTVIDTARGLPSNAVNSLARDRRGRVWVGSSQGLARIEGDRAVAVGTGLPKGSAMSLLFLPDGRLVVGTERGPYVGDDDRFVSLHADMSRDAVIQIVRDPDGTLWFGTVGAGLARLQGGTLERLDVGQGLPNSRVLTLRRDREGSLWIGTNGGLVRLRAAPIRAYTRAHGLSDDFVRSVLPATDGRVWIGTAKGLDVFEPEAARARTVGVGTPLAGASVLSVAAAADGAGIWVGTFHDGAMRWHDGRIVESVGVDDGMPSSEVRVVHVDRAARLWLGTKLGVVLRDREGLRVFATADGLPGDYVQALYEDRAGTIWVGTNAGAGTIASGRARTLDLRGAGDAQYVFGFAELPGVDGVWLATDRGLVRATRDGQLAQVGIDRGLPFEKVFAIVPDGRGAVWITANGGIARLAQADLVAVAEGRLARLPARLFGHSDGMVSSQANGGSNPSAGLGADGRVWVATAQGVARIAAGAVGRRLPALPPILIEAFAVDGRAMPTTGEPVLPPGSDRLAFGFATPALVSAHRVRYRYRLEALDANWIDLGERREVQFTHLDPGRYVLELQAYVPGEAARASTQRFAFRIEPHWWQQRWVVALALLAVALVLGGAYATRMRRLRATERRLRALVDERTRALQVQTRIAEELARTDALTALANRRALDEALDVALANARARATPVCLLLVDIDHFKAVNDGHSHAVGDLALRAVAAILQAQSRQHDLAARWGGEEFALLLADCTRTQAQAVAERVRSAIESLDCDSFAPGLRLTASIGIACEPGDGSVADLIARADAALYRAKREGRNRVEDDALA